MNIQVGKSTRAAEGRRNEDSYKTINNFYAVADGVSKEGEGSVASNSAVCVAANIIEKDKNINLGDLVNKLRQNVKEGATTFTAARITEENEEKGNYLLEVIHLGDSKAFLIRNDSIEQLTEEHKGKDGITKGLGRAFEKIYKEKEIEHIDPFYRILPLQKGDKIVLASDGLDVGNENIKKIVKRNNPQKAADTLVKKSSRGDDVSVIVIGVDNEEGNYSNSREKIAIGAGALFAAAAIAGILIYKEYSKPLAPEEPVATAMIEKEKPGQEKSEEEIKPPFDLKIPETIKKTSKREWYTNRANQAKPDKDELELKISNNAWYIDGMKSVDKNNAYLRITTKDDRVDVLKFSNSLADGYVKNNRLDENVKWAEVVELIQNEKAEYVLKVYATYDSAKTQIKGASINPDNSLDDLLKSYSRATFEDSDDVKKDMKRFERFNSHVEKIADHYAEHGKEETLDTYSMLNDSPAMLRKALSYAWNDLGCKRKTRLSSLSSDELRIIKDAYYSGTNKEALKKIRKMTGMDMSEKTIYTALDRVGEIDGKIYRKNIKDYRMVS